MSAQAITDILRSSEALILLWHVLLALGAGYLVVMGLAAFAAREKLKGFLRGFATGIGVNTFESLTRGLMGVAFMGASPDGAYPVIAFWFGAVLAVTAIPMLLLPRTHRRFAGWAVPFAISILPLYGVLSFVFGVGLLWFFFA